MFKGLRLDALDIIFFVVGAVAGGLLAAFVVPAGAPSSFPGIFILGAGFGAIKLRTLVHPKVMPEFYEEAVPYATGRSMAAAACLALGMVLAPLSALVVACLAVSTIFHPSVKGILWLAVAALALFIGVKLFRFGYHPKVKRAATKPR